MRIEPGTYVAKCIGAQTGESKTGTPHIALEFEVTDGAWSGQRISAYRYLSEKTMDRTLEDMRTCGWTGKDLTDLSGIYTNDVEIVVADETYEGKTYARVQWINKLGGKASGAPLPEDKLALVNQRIRARLAMVDKKIADQRQGQKPLPLDDDKVPF